MPTDEPYVLITEHPERNQITISMAAIQLMPHRAAIKTYIGEILAKLVKSSVLVHQSEIEMMVREQISSKESQDLIAKMVKEAIEAHAKKITDDLLSR